MTRTALAGAGRQPTNRWGRLGTVARERASEQSVKAADAPDRREAIPHLEQEAYLGRLAEVYERRAKDWAAAT